MLLYYHSFGIIEVFLLSWGLLCIKRGVVVNSIAFTSSPVNPKTRSTDFVSADDPSKIIAIYRSDRESIDYYTVPELDRDRVKVKLGNKQEQVDKMFVCSQSRRKKREFLFALVTTHFRTMVINTDGELIYDCPTRLDPRSSILINIKGTLMSFVDSLNSRIYSFSSTSDNPYYSIHDIQNKKTKTIKMNLKGVKGYYLHRVCGNFNTPKTGQKDSEEVNSYLKDNITTHDNPNIDAVDPSTQTSTNNPNICMIYCEKGTLNNTILWLHPSGEEYYCTHEGYLNGVIPVANPSGKAAFVMFNSNSLLRVSLG